MLRRLFAGLVLVLCFPEIGSAAGFNFSPVTIEIPASARAGVVTLTNTDSAPLSFQIRIFKWSQAGDGGDVLEPADDLMIVSPPALTIPPESSYQIRIARRSPGPVGGEQSYRLFIDQLSPPKQDENGNSMGVAILLRASLPVFVTDARAEAQLAWRVRQDADGLHVGVTNSGSRRVKLSNLSLQPESGSLLSFGTGLTGYVLPGVSREFTFKPAEGESVPTLPKGSQAAIIADETDGTISSVVSVE